MTLLKLKKLKHFSRGVSLGYLGMIYDKAYRVEESTDVTTIEFEDYSKIIDYVL